MLVNSCMYSFTWTWGISISWSSEVQLPLLTLDMGYLFRAAPVKHRHCCDLGRGVSPLSRLLLQRRVATTPRSEKPA